MDKKNKELPEIEIQGTIFQFDIESLLLIEKNNPINMITFAYMEDRGTHYTFNYSPLSKNHDFIIINPDFDDTGKIILDPYFESSVKVVIPRITELDPEGFSRKYGCTKKDMDEKTDFELMVDQKIYNERIDGHPVKVTFCGNEYIVDPDNDILWSMSNKPDIELRELENYYNIKSKAFDIFYEPISGRVIDVLKNGLEESEMVRMVQIPHIRTLDPIGKNHAENLPLQFGLIYHKLQLEHDLLFTHDEISQVIPAHKNENGQMELLIEGTTFIVDINKFEFRDKDDPENIIPLSEMSELDNGYSILYKGKEINLPEFVELDPQGMAKKYNVSVQDIQAHDDFHFMVDQDAYSLRMKGQLPTIDIEGHTFTVDIRMNMLRSATDFHSRGINFDEIDDHYSEEKDVYIIPYDPIKHEFRDLDYDNLFSIPKDLIAVEFPLPVVLDPIGWNRENGNWDLKSDLKWIGIKSHFEAKTIPWEQTFIVDIIRDNKQERQMKDDDQKKNKSTNQNKGRKM